MEAEAKELKKRQLVAKHKKQRKQRTVAEQCVAHQTVAANTKHPAELIHLHAFRAAAAAAAVQKFLALPGPDAQNSKTGTRNASVEFELSSPIPSTML